jgi:hypothetical protein
MQANAVKDLARRGVEKSFDLVGLGSFPHLFSARCPSSFRCQVDVEDLDFSELLSGHVRATFSVSVSSALFLLSTARRHAQRASLAGPDSFGFL